MARRTEGSFPATAPKKWTERKRLFVKLIAGGHDKASVCEIMCICPQTYTYYQASAMWLLAANTMPHMISRALQERIITIDDTLRFKVYYPDRSLVK